MITPDLPGVRAVILVHVDRVSSSCGYSMPLMTYEGDRDKLEEWADARASTAFRAYSSNAQQ